MKMHYFGVSRFFGDEDFLSLANDAMKEIERLDPTIHKEITASKIIYTSQWKNLSLAATFRNRYTIEKWIAESGIDGIIFGIITYFSHYRTQQMKRPDLLGHGILICWVCWLGFGLVC